MVERPESGTGALPRLANILEAWRAAERRLAAGDGDMATLALEVRRLREDYRRLQEARVREEAEGTDDGWSDDSPTDRRLSREAMTPSGLGTASG